MKKKATNQENIKKLVLIGLLTALTIALSYIKIPLVGTVTITLVLPVVVIGAALCGPWVGAWLTVIPNISAFTEAGIFMVYSPVGCIATLLLKGILAGLAAGFWADRDELISLAPDVREFTPEIDADKRASLLDGWRRAVRACREFSKTEE
jgi:predicted membrane protein